ncbi:MAG: nickel pincer cofactor biosynthesis protein LarC [Methanosarcinales archaeon]|nr:nickel pincer cofactor biosynthesis protein LarC [Methanosarcinales archaeon]
MKALLFDPFSGASGDMIMGCLLDLGADPSAVDEAVQSVGCRLEIAPATRGHLRATRAIVRADRRFHTLAEACSILEESSLGPAALSRARGILDALAAAEGRVHAVEKEEVHFHEIGALDALADIAGCCAALENLKPERVLSLPVFVGGGTVRSAHGLLPVPAPATMEILSARSIPWQGGPAARELLTPTGAAILANVVDDFLEAFPQVRASRVGYGAGSWEGEEVHNLLRGVVGTVRHHLGTDRVSLLETNVDDVTGEVLGNLVDLLMQDGALDVSVIPAVMKKGRSGSLIRVIVREDDLERISLRVMRETGSLGLRIFPVMHRLVAGRRGMLVKATLGGAVHEAKVKVSFLGQEVLNVKPEFEDCKRIASATGLPLKEVARALAEEGWRQVGEDHPS